jgi:superfamily II DNA or RNA helicase
MVSVRFRGNNLYIKANSKKEAQSLPKELQSFCLVNKENLTFQCLPLHYYKVRELLNSCSPSLSIEWHIHSKSEINFSNISNNFSLRPYQQEALDAWLANKSKGVIVLPTGSGKTFVALAAITEKQINTLIVVPTINLLDQWQERLSDYLAIEEDLIGIFGGGEQELRPITITTYDSGALYYRQFREEFGLLICDEVHHLPTETYRRIAEQLIAPFRLGLTATLKRPDMKHADVEQSLIGPVVYHITPEKIQSTGYVANFNIAKIYVELTEEERLAYEKMRGIYRNYLARNNIRLRSGQDFQQKLLRRMAWDHNARKAVKAHHTARVIALTAKKKIQALDNLLTKHSKDSVLIFSEYNEVVELVSNTFLIPAITHKTTAKERKIILKYFESGKITKLATGRVLDEGFDVKRPSVAIIMSGSSVERQYIQRLGRILRPAKGKKAILYEVITQDTLEVQSSKRRSQFSNNERS